MLNKHCQDTLNHLRMNFFYPDRMGIGAKLVQLRNSKGWNQDQMGEAMGVTKGMISQWENDIGKPTIERLIMLHEKIDFSFDWLLTEQSVYSTTDPKLVSIMHALEPQAEYVKDAAVSAVLRLVNSRIASKTTVRMAKILIFDSTRARKLKTHR